MNNKNQKVKKAKKKSMGEVYEEMIKQRIKECDKQIEKLIGMKALYITPGHIAEIYEMGIRQWNARRNVYRELQEDVKIELG